MVWACFKKYEGDRVRRCLAYEVESTRSRGRAKKTWKGVVDNDLKCLHLHHCKKWRKLIRGKQYHCDMKVETVGDVYILLIWRCLRCWRQDLCRCRTTSLEQSPTQYETMWAVTRPVQPVVTEDIFIRTVRPRRSVN